LVEELCYEDKLEDDDAFLQGFHFFLEATLLLSSDDEFFYLSSDEEFYLLSSD